MYKVFTALIRYLNRCFSMLFYFSTLLCFKYFQKPSIFIHSGSCCKKWNFCSINAGYPLKIFVIIIIIVRFQKHLTCTI